MLEVNIEKIIPVTDARDALNKIVDEVSGSDEMYVLTVNGKPSAVVVGVHHLEKLTGKSESEFMNAAAPVNSTPTSPNSDAGEDISVMPNDTAQNDGVTTPDAVPQTKTDFSSPIETPADTLASQTPADDVSSIETGDLFPEPEIPAPSASLGMEDSSATLGAPVPAPDPESQLATPAPDQFVTPDSNDLNAATSQPTQQQQQ